MILFHCIGCPDAQMPPTHTWMPGRLGAAYRFRGCPDAQMPPTHMWMPGRMDAAYAYVDARTPGCCHKFCRLTVGHRWVSFRAQSSVVRDSKHLSQSDFRMTGRAQPPIRGVRPRADIHVRLTLMARELLRLSNSLRRSREKNPSVSRLCL
jgi:hypothetical protein